MQRKRFWLISGATLVAGLFLVGNFAKAEPRGTPFDSLWAAIGTLRADLTALIHRVDTIVLTPGPVGPQGPQGEAGATGPQGNAGPTGPQGASWSAGNFYYRYTSFELPAFLGLPAVNRVRVNCDPGDVALGGGFRAGMNVRVTKSFPPITAIAPGSPGIPNPSIWEVEAQNESPFLSTVVAYVRCVDVP